MKRSGVFPCLSAGIAALGLMAAGVGPANADEVVNMKLQGAFPSTLPVLGTAGKRLTEAVSKLSNRSLRMKFFEPGALLPASTYTDALIEGSLKVGYGATGLHAGKEPALNFFVAVPFGPRPVEFMGWVNHGGGRELANEIYARLGMRLVFPCSTSAPETAGWFKKQVNSIDELSGTKMRIFGYGAMVLQKFGVSTQYIAPTDIYPALERGVIDQTEFSMPVTDEALGFAEIAKFNYFPGWHQQASLQSMDFNAAAYDDLSDYHKFVVEAACAYTNNLSLAESGALQIEAMERMRTEKGVQTLRWPDEDLAKFQAAWEEVVAEQAAKSEVFKKVYESYRDFRKSYEIWGGMAYVTEPGVSAMQNK